MKTDDGQDKFPLSGVVVSLDTPFDASGKIDFNALGRLLKMHLAEGAAGFLTPAQTAPRSDSLRTTGAARSGTAMANDSA